MNTKDFYSSRIPLGEATRRATDFVSQFILAVETKPAWKRNEGDLPTRLYSLRTRCAKEAG